MILRGHLLIEELLDQLIAAHLKYPKAINDARLTFFQKLCIAQGMIGRSNEDFTWIPIKKLNELRNSISHNLPDDRFSERLDSVLKAFFENEFDEIPKDIYSKSKALRKGIIFHCAHLYGFREGIRAARSRKSQLGKSLTEG